MNHQYESIEELTARHERWRGSCLNLIAAENVMSPAVHAAMGTDLVHRYADYLGRDLDDRKYFGGQFVVEIEKEVQRLARDVFSAAFVETRPLSGHVAGSAVIMSLTTPGARVMEVGSDGGGHRLAEKLAVAPLTPLAVEFLPFDGQHYTIDTDAAIAAIRRFRPSLVILGSSNFLFPHPVAEIAANVPEGTTLVYDASHVMGLLAGGEFQNPLAEGASIVFGSTHKTFPGPPGGIVFTNSRDLIERVSTVVYPGLVTNHHPGRMPALALALLEMQRWGGDYARTVVRNAQLLGGALHERGLRLVGEENGFTRSHTLLIATSAHGSSKEVGARLEAAGIITNPAKLPEMWGREGIRIGVQEVTRRGISSEGLISAAGLIADVVTGARHPDGARSATAELAAEFGNLRFTWSDHA